MLRCGSAFPSSSISDRRQNTTPTSGWLREERELLLELRRLPGVVGVEERDELAAASPMPRFFARDWPSRSERKYRTRRSARNGRTASGVCVGRAVVDDEEFPVGERLREHRLDRGRQEPGVVLRGHDDGDERTDPAPLPGRGLGAGASISAHRLQVFAGHLRDAEAVLPARLLRDRVHELHVVPHARAERLVDQLRDLPPARVAERLVGHEADPRVRSATPARSAPAPCRGCSSAKFSVSEMPEMSRPAGVRT